MGWFGCEHDLYPASHSAWSGYKSLLSQTSSPSEQTQLCPDLTPEVHKQVDEKLFNIPQSPRESQRVCLLTPYYSLRLQCYWVIPVVTGGISESAVGGRLSVSVCGARGLLSAGFWPTVRTGVQTDDERSHSDWLLSRANQCARRENLSLSGSIQQDVSINLSSTWLHLNYNRSTCLKVCLTSDMLVLSCGQYFSSLQYNRRNITHNAPLYQ